MRHLFAVALVIGGLFAAAPAFAQSSCVYDRPLKALRQGQPADAAQIKAQSAGAATWFVYSLSIKVAGREYDKYGLPRGLAANDLRYLADAEGVPVFTAVGDVNTDVVYIPSALATCEFQPYRAK